MPDDAVVIRGGKGINTGRARLNAMDVYRQTGQWGLCVAAHPSSDADDIAHRWDYTGEFYTQTTAGVIRAIGAGYDVILDSADVHAILILPREPQRDHIHDPMWAELQTAFIDPPAPNPNYS